MASERLIEAAQEDAIIGMLWWNHLNATQRVEWMRKAANTGVAADAWEMFKSGTHAGSTTPP